MTLFRRMFTTKRSIQKYTLYRTIEDLPIWNWERCKRGELRYLIIEGESDGVSDGVLNELWGELQDEFNEKCGMSDRGSHGMDKITDLYKAIRDEIIYSCDDHNPKLSRVKTKRRILEKEIEQMPISEQTLEDQAIQMEIFFTRDFDVKKTSVLRWYKYLQEYEKRTEQLRSSYENNQKAAV